MGVTLEQIDSKLDRILEVLEEFQETVRENNERQEEAIANLSLPGSNYSIDRLED